MAKAKDNTLKLKFDSARQLAPAPESKSAATIHPRYELFINGKFQPPLSKKIFCHTQSCNGRKIIGSSGCQ